MRPDSLSPLFASVQSLERIGSRTADALARLVRRASEPTGARIIDLLLHFPTSLIDRRARPKIAEAEEGALVTMEIRVTRHAPSPRRSRAPYKIYGEDDTGTVELVFFHADQSYLQRLLPVGEQRIISGRVVMYDDQLQMTHPDHVVAPDALDELPLIEPVYPMTAGLSGKVLFGAIAQSVERIPDLKEWQDQTWWEAQKWPTFAEALCAVHAPQSDVDLDPASPTRSRLAFDELLANQLALALVRSKLRRVAGRQLKATDALRNTLIANLPFSLTGAQQRTLAEIDADMASHQRMLRLLQGDVGSGKTVVAALAMTTAVEAGTQAALMAPTEVLVRQHLKWFGPIADQLGLTIACLTGREKGKERAEILEKLGAGEIDFLIGTHALFQDDVAFRDLGLAVIDEQHRFGVHQRLALQGKSGLGAHMLVMTATPIPRTLMLTHYGDMDASRLDEKPAGRQPIATRAVPIERTGSVLARLDKAVSDGAQAYWVCPLVEESETLNIGTAEDRYAELQVRYGERVGLVHGKLKSTEKDRVMAGFAAGDISVLVATTVIEVGVDVPAATIMVIEHAERFGLAQLHQLRGRVGRGSGASSCILLYKSPLTETALARLNVLRETEDGFVIAEEDLRLRGAGEVLGTRQSGVPDFRLAAFPAHTELLAAARDDVKLILDRDPELTSDRGKALRELLYLFERDAAVRLIKAG